jgi:putative ABC transport system substrate-binding protein
MKNRFVLMELEKKRPDLNRIGKKIDSADPELIYTIGTKAYLLGNRLAPEKIIVFSSIINWQRLAITPKSFGVSNELHAGMEIMIFRMLFPALKNIGVLYSEEYSRHWFENAKNQAKAMGVHIIGREVDKKSDSLSILNSFIDKLDAFWLISDPLVMRNKSHVLKIMKQATSKKMPVFSQHNSLLRYGAVLAVSVDDRTIGRQAARIASELLKSRKPPEKVQYPAGSHVILNLKNVRKYGVEYNENALSSVNYIIK